MADITAAEAVTEAADTTAAAVVTDKFLKGARNSRIALKKQGY